MGTPARRSSCSRAFSSAQIRSWSNGTITSRRTARLQRMKNRSSAGPGGVHSVAPPDGAGADDRGHGRALDELEAGAVVGRVVGAAEGTDLGVLGGQVGEPSQHVRPHGDVVVEEEEQVAARPARRAGSGLRRGGPGRRGRPARRGTGRGPRRRRPASPSEHTSTSNGGGSTCACRLARHASSIEIRRPVTMQMLRTGRGSPDPRGSIPGAPPSVSIPRGGRGR